MKKGYIVNFHFGHEWRGNRIEPTFPPVSEPDQHTAEVGIAGVNVQTLSTDFLGPADQQAMVAACESHANEGEPLHCAHYDYLVALQVDAKRRRRWPT